MWNQYWRAGNRKKIHANIIYIKTSTFESDTPVTLP